MADSFLDSLKNVVPSLEKATEVNYCLLLTNFVLFADCASLYANGINILHLSEVPNFIKPRLAIEAVILVIGFGILIIMMRIVRIFVNSIVIETVVRLWTSIEARTDINDQQFRRPSATSVSIIELSEKAHATKESYYLDLLKAAEAKEAEYWDKTTETSLFAFTVLMLSCIDLYAPLSPEGSGILTQIADRLGQNTFSLLFWGGCILVLVVLAFYPVFVFEYHHPWVHCSGLAQELEKKKQEKREQEDRFRREAEARKASPPPSLPDIGGRLGGRLGAGVVATNIRDQKSDPRKNAP